MRNYCYFKLLFRQTVNLCGLFNLLHCESDTPQIKFTASIDLHIPLVTWPDIGQLLDIWLLLQGILTALLP